MNALKKLFGYSDQIVFEVHGDRSQAANRLSQLASKPILQATFSGEPSKPVLVGTVSQDHVRLHKITPLFGNAFKPVFIGRFQSDNGRSSLVGRFQMGLVGKIITTIFLLFTLFIQILLLPGLVVDGIAALQPSLFLLGGILLVLAIKAYSKRDVPWIKAQIDSALR
jgi:hypothetical protein